MATEKITIEPVTRIEGHAKVTIHMKDDGSVDHAYFHVNEFRGFEKFCEGRMFFEMPQITPRICGICPVAYQMSSSHAMEQACGVTVGGALRELRRLIYCGEWIESHGLHIYMLHAPDFLGYEDAIAVAKDYPDIVQRGLKLKKIGNDLMIVLGGREIHPINPRVGGFYRVPSRKELEALVEPLTWALEASLETVRWTAGLSFPSLERDYECVSLRHEDEYPLCEGRVVSNKGVDVAIEDFLKAFEEEHVPHSTSLHAYVKDRGDYLAGPMARYNNNFDKLPKVAQDAAREAGLGETCMNPFKSIIVRAVELVFACHEALRIINSYEPPEGPFVECTPRNAVGSGCTEAPRGLLYHRYQIDDQGLIRSARIIPPTSQNQKAIEADLRQFVQQNLNLTKDKLTWQCEQTDSARYRAGQCISRR